MKTIITITFFAFSFSCFAQTPAKTAPFSLTAEGSSSISIPHLDADSITRYRAGYKRPQFPGGEAAMKKFIASVFKYPERPVYKGINDYCGLQFFVNPDGSISGIIVTKKVEGCEECDQEAIRILKLMPAWIPGQEYSKNVKMESLVAIPFNFLK